jgi:hypothetical protein
MIAANMSRHMGDDPAQISMFVHCAMERQVLKTTLRTLELRPKDPRVLKLSRDVLAALGPATDLHRVISGEIVLAHRLNDVLGDRGAERFFRDVGIKEDQANDLNMRGLRFEPVRLANEVTMLRYWRVYDEKMPKDPEDIAAVEAAQTAATAAVSSESASSRVMLELVTRLTGDETEPLRVCLAQRRVLASAIAALEQHARTGKFPADIAGDGRASRDPFGRGLLRYLPTKTGFLLYSVGPNHRDDGGSLVEPPKTGHAADLGLRINLP